MELSKSYTHWQVILVWLVLGMFVFAMVWYYANRRIPYYVHFSVFIGWLFPFSMVLLLPLDMTSFMYRECVADSISHPQSSQICETPVLYVSEQFLLIAWRTIYWTMYVLTYLILPFIISYSDNGYFTVIERAKKSLRANFIYYGILFALGVCAVFWIIITNRLNQWSALLQFAMSVANMYGLTFLVVFLAYGLTEVPRSFWTGGNRRRSLRYLEHRAPSVKEALHSAEEEYDTLAKQAHAISQKTAFDDSLRPFIDVVVAKCPLDSSTGSPGPVSAEYEQLDMLKLARLHKEIIRAVREKEKCEYEWNDLLEKTFHLQDLITVANDSSMKYYSFTRKPYEGFLARFMPTLQWFWYVLIEPVVLRLLAVIFALLSLVILWSETTYLVPNPILSIIGIIFNISGISYVVVELLAVTFLLYICLCAVNSLFRIKIFNIYSIHPNHHTSEVSLCWFANQLCRFTFPLGYNFMYMAAFKKTVLIQFMGDMVGAQFQTFVPVLVVVIVLLNLFNVVARLMNCLGFSDDFMSEDEKDSGWGDVEEGKILISDARNTYVRNGGGFAPLDGRREASTGLLAGRPSTDGVVVNERPAVSNTTTSNPSSTTNAVRPLKDLSQTKSKYLLNNPLYQKYQNKGARKKDDDDDYGNNGGSGDEDHLAGFR